MTILANIHIYLRVRVSQLVPVNPALQTQLKLTHSPPLHSRSVMQELAS